MSGSNTWDPVRVKAQLRLAAQRLGQLQDRKDSLAHITSRDIATLLSQRNVSLARTKAQNLMKEDALSNAMEVLEMYCGLVLERFSELEKDELNLHPSTVEAIAGIIYAAGYTQCQDLVIVRGMLAERLGPGFAQSALYNSDGHVSQRILRLVHLSPSADQIDEYLSNIAHKFNADWKAQMKMDEKLAVLSETLNASDTLGTVDLGKLREIAFSGVPTDPSWLRPRVWKLLLGTTPLMKVQWESESRKKRNDYYDLIRRLLVNVPSLPPPTSPLSAPDKALLALVESLSRVPPHLFRGLEDEVEQSASCPVHGSAPEDIKISCAFALDARLQLIQDGPSKGDEDSSVSSTPEIRLDSGSAPSSPRESSFDLSEAAQGSSQPRPKTLSSSVTLGPKVFRSVPAHPTHVSALLRLLYTHRSLNPGAESPYLASLLLPVYTVMNQEADPMELAHAEADTFWSFEVLIREVAELAETEDGVVWMKKFRDRLAMADNELLEDLILKGLDPSLPQYSYRWLAPVLSHTLSLPSVLMAWDSIFAEPEMTRQSNPRLEHLLDICTAMLVRVRARLLLLGKNGRKSPSLWDIEPSGVHRQLLRPWELSDAFMEGMTLLQNYPIDEAGRMERVLQVAGDIFVQREQLSRQPQTHATGLGAMIRESFWRGITNQTTEENNSPEDSEEGSGGETETVDELPQSKDVPQTSSTGKGWGSYLKTTVIRGITNESAMDSDSPGTSPLPSPVPSAIRLSREASPQPPPPVQHKKSSTFPAVPNAASGFWSYAEKLRQSDMAAKLSKASTNISAKALDAWTTRSTSTHEASTASDKHCRDSVGGAGTECRADDNDDGGLRRSSLPSISHSDSYSPPPRPAFFKLPRDTRMFSQEEVGSLKIPDSPESTHSSLSASTISAGEPGRVASIASVLPSWTGLQPKSPKPTKTAPKPLLLSASSLVATGHSRHISRSANSTPIPHNTDWSEVMRSKHMTSPRHRDSQHSLTSVSSRHSNPTASPRDSRSSWDSDQSGSRVVRLNRGSISPMAPAFRIARASSRNPSVSSQSEFGVLNYKTGSESSPSAASAKLHDGVPHSSHSRDRVPPDSPATVPSSPPPRTPVTNGGVVQSSVRVANVEKQRGSLVLSEPGFSSIDSTPQQSKTPHKSSSPTVVAPVGDISDSSLPPASPLTRNTPRVRTKRINASHARPASLRIRDSTVSSERKSTSMSISSASPSSLAAPGFDSGVEVATTPRAAQFPSTSPTDTQPRSPRRRKTSVEGPERRRKLSSETNGVRARNISSESKPARTRKISGSSYSRRESVADDGDDEGYDDVLSAYESEESKYESASSEA